MSENSPEPLGEILSKLFTARGWGKQQERVRLEMAWAAAVGPEYAAKTRVMGVRRNTLEVEVNGAVVMQELSQFHKRRILAKLKESFQRPVITEIRFKSNVWE
jgi:predicted nucleic acid-binding Zn ribbon protein